MILSVFAIYIVTCIGVYLFQEKLIFFPQKLAKNYHFDFANIEEFSINVDDIELNALLFKSKNPKGVIFYLHGNGGNLQSWGDVADTHRALNYDVFMVDYRGYGKSEGKISSQKQIFNDINRAYKFILQRYKERDTIILGYSIGTGLATYLASIHNPKMLILQAPYYSLREIAKNRYPIIPTFLLKYKFPSNQYIPKCKMPIIIFHGLDDTVIPYSSSLKLKKLLKQKDRLISLKNQGHNAITQNRAYLDELRKIL